MKHILLLTTIITLSACAPHVHQIRCPIELPSGKIIEGDCSNGDGIPSGILDGGSKPAGPKDDHPTKPDVKPEPPKDKPKEEPKKDNHHGHGKGHFSGGFSNGEGKGWQDHKDW